MLNIKILHHRYQLLISTTEIAVLLYAEYPIYNNNCNFLV